MASPRAAMGGEKTTIGWVEKAWIKEADIVLNARIGTGTRTSSLDADDIHVFTSGNNTSVRFVIERINGKPVKIERLLIRFAQFKKQGQGIERRPVVELGICINGVYQTTEVILLDRNQSKYPLLIGRKLLAENFIVDSEKRFSKPPHCIEMPKEEHSSGIIVHHELGPSGE